MKKLNKDLQAVTRELKTLTRKTEQMAKKVDKLEKAQAAGKRKPKAKAKTTKKAPAKKKGAVKKTAALTATDQAVKIIKRSKKGVDVPTLKKRPDSKIRKSGISSTGRPSWARSRELAGGFMWAPKTEASANSWAEQPSIPPPWSPQNGTEWLYGPSWGHLQGPSRST